MALKENRKGLGREEESERKWNGKRSFRIGSVCLSLLSSLLVSIEED
jgi:hypothetical protein